MLLHIVKGKGPVLSLSSRATIIEQRLDNLQKDGEWWKEWKLSRATAINSQPAAIEGIHHLETVGEAAVESSMLIEDAGNSQGANDVNDRHFSIQPSPEPSSSKEL